MARRLQLELLKESPLAFAWLTYALKVVLDWLFGLGKPLGVPQGPRTSKQHWSDFREPQAAGDPGTDGDYPGCGLCAHRETARRRNAGSGRQPEVTSCTRPGGCGGRLAAADGTIVGKCVPDDFFPFLVSRNDGRTRLCLGRSDGDSVRSIK